MYEAESHKKRFKVGKFANIQNIGLSMYCRIKLIPKTLPN